MITLELNQRAAPDCSGISRRNFVRAGFLGLGSLTLADLLRMQSQAAEGSFIKDKSVVMVFLSGGASHIETFNPNMDGPEPSRSVTGSVATSIPGTHLGGTFPRLAKLINNIAIVRSFAHNNGNHDQAISHVLTGGTDPNGQAALGFSIGAATARLGGTNHPKTGFPSNVLLTAPHKDPQYNREIPRVVKGSRAGTLGDQFAPFIPAGKGPAIDNLKLRLDADQLEDRRTLLKQLDDLKQGLDSGTVSGTDQFDRQAVELLLNGSQSVFDITKEPADVRKRYDTSSFKCGKKIFEPSVLGNQFLIARRLIEAGSRYVTIHSAGWDMHADGNNPGIKDGINMLGKPLDQALGCFMEDLQQRGMLDKVLIVVTGDFGRTPKINNRGGRDHWASLGTLAFMGGGIEGGPIIGQTDRNNAKPADKPYTTINMFATVLNALFDVGTLRVQRGIPGDLMKAIEAPPIPIVG
ncbi:MAG: DUF1501 domain-containing protein [Zavarzinella sp.]